MLPSSNSDLPARIEAQICFGMPDIQARPAEGWPAGDIRRRLASVVLSKARDGRRGGSVEGLNREQCSAAGCSG